MVEVGRELLAQRETSEGVILSPFSRLKQICEKIEPDPVPGLQPTPRQIAEK